MKLDQKIGWFGRESFLLLEDKIRIEGVAPLRRSEFAINFSEMHENPVRTRNLALSSYVVGGLLVLGSAGSLAMALLTRAEAATLGWTGFIVMVLVGAATLFSARRRSYDVVIFRTMTGNCVLRTNNPDRERFSAFISELQRRIADSRSIERRTIAGVLDVLRRQEIIDDWQHQQLRAQFELKGPSSEA